MEDLARTNTELRRAVEKAYPPDASATCEIAKVLMASNCSHNYLAMALTDMSDGGTVFAGSRERNRWREDGVSCCCLCVGSLSSNGDAWTTGDLDEQFWPEPWIRQRSNE